MHLTEPRTAARLDREPSAFPSEHAALGAWAESCEGLLGSLARGSVGRAQGADAQLLFGEFRRRLVEYLVSEERNAVLERAAAEAPRFARRVERLREHRGELREHVDALASRLGGAAAGSEPGWARIHARFLLLRRVLRDHEQAENDVLQCTYLDDIGSGD